MNENYNKILGFYIHIPFCDHICSYCDFKKMKASFELQEKYIDALCEEIKFKNKYFSDVETIYIGGGTPSSLSFKLLTNLLDTIKEYINLDNIKEFTIEANPKDINSNNISLWIDLFKKYHINRLSLGIQSFYDKKLKFLNRNHNKKDAINTLKLLHKNKFQNVNCDLIYGFPDDDYYHIKKDMKIAIRNHVKHISYYSLILEENTYLSYLYKKGKFKPMDDDKEGTIYNKIYKFLSKKHYNRYEISNFSINGFESKHNLLTWENLHYQAVGVSASFYVNNTRYTNINSILDYIKLINNKDFNSIVKEKYELSKEDMMYEAVMLGLRKNNGINIIEFKDRYGISIIDAYPNIKNLIKKDILIIKNGNLMIKYDKIYLENAILNKIFE